MSGYCQLVVQFMWYNTVLRTFSPTPRNAVNQCITNCVIMFPLGGAYMHIHIIGHRSVLISYIYIQNLIVLLTGKAASEMNRGPMWPSHLPLSDLPSASQKGRHVVSHPASASHRSTIAPCSDVAKGAPLGLGYKIPPILER